MTKVWTQELFEELTEDIAERWVMVSGQGDTAIVAVAPACAFPVQQKLEEGARNYEKLDSEFTVSFIVESLEDDKMKGDEV
jgi:UDP-N-acetylglucosamine transferase subunit ALG13